MINYKINIEYNGTGLAGWQRQNDKLSVQELIENAIFEAFQEKVGIIGAGRTDAGVHAIGQVANFHLRKEISEFELTKALNYYLKLDGRVAIRSTEIVEDDFHARFSAKSRVYKYLILNRRSYSSILKDKVVHIPYDLNLKRIKQASKYFIGEHDFSSFRDARCGAKSPIRNITRFEVKESDLFEDVIEFEIEANAFLHHMIRIVMGSLIDVGREKIEAEDIKRIIEAKDRTKAGKTMPAHGLYFYRVIY
jgi:tRNA pseudouridine38-40 synthase